MTLSQQLAGLGLNDARQALTRAQAARVFTTDHQARLHAAITERLGKLVSAGRRVDASIIGDEERSKLNSELLDKARTETHAAHNAIAALRPKLQALRRAARGPAPLPPALSDEERARFVRSDAMNFELQRLILRELRGLRMRHDVASLSLAQKLDALHAGEAAKDVELVHFLEPVIERELQAATPKARADGNLAALQEEEQAHQVLVGRLESIRDARVSEADRQALTEAEATLATLEHDAQHDDQVWRALEYARTIVPASTEVVSA
jgi:hypothetical protein